MSSIVSYCLGFLMGAAVFKVVSLVARGRWLILFLSVGVASQAMTFKVINVGGSNINLASVAIEYDGSGQSIFSPTIGNCSSGNNGTWEPGEELWFTTSGSGTAATTLVFKIGALTVCSLGQGDFTGVDCGSGLSRQTTSVYESDGSGVYTPDCLPSKLDFSYTASWPGEYRLHVWAQGAGATNSTIGTVLSPLEIYRHMGVGDTWTQSITNNCDAGTLHYVLVGPGGADANFAVKVLDEGDGTTGSAPPGSGSNPGIPTIGDDDPIAEKPERTGLPTDEKVADRQNAEAIVDAIDRAKSELAKHLRDISTNTLNALSLSNSVTVNMTNITQITTNNFDLSAVTNLLSQIRTNTTTITNQLTAYTNQSALEFYTSNRVLAAFKGRPGYEPGTGIDNVSEGVNVFEQSASASAIDAAIAGVKTSETNQGTIAGGGGAFQYGIPLAVAGTHTLDLSTAESGGGFGAVMKAKAITFCNFIRSWFLKLIPFIMFWAVMWAVLEWKHEIVFCFVNSVQPSAPGNLTFEGIAAKVFTVPAVVVGISVALGLLLGFVPALVVAKAQGTLYSGSYVGAIPSITEHIVNEADSSFLAESISFWNGLQELIPFTTLIFCAVHYYAFQLYGKRLVLFCITAITYISPALRIGILFAFLGGQVNAAEVEVLNFKGTNVVFTKDAVTLTIPPGQFEFNLEAGEWDVDGAGLEVPSTEDRLYIRCEGSGVSATIGESDWSFFWAGFKSGVIVFGTVTMVSALLGGVRQAVRRSFPGSEAT